MTTDIWIILALALGGIAFLVFRLWQLLEYGERIAQDKARADRNAMSYPHVRAERTEGWRD